MGCFSSKASGPVEKVPVKKKVSGYQPKKVPEPKKKKKAYGDASTTGPRDVPKTPDLHFENPVAAPGSVSTSGESRSEMVSASTEQSQELGTACFTDAPINAQASTGGESRSEIVFSSTEQSEELGTACFIDAPINAQVVAPGHFSLEVDDEEEPRRQSAVVTLGQFQEERKDYIIAKCKKETFEPITGGEYSTSAVRRHCTESSLWLIIHNKVYDATSFVESHPGGAWNLLNQGGKDCTDAFKKYHSVYAWKKLDEFFVANVDGADGGRQASMVPSQKTLMDVANYAPFPVIGKTQLTHDVVRVTFKLPRIANAAPFVVPPGGHVVVQATDVARSSPYTPIEVTSEAFTLIVKKYPRGVVSTCLFDVKVGDELMIRGPISCAFQEMHHTGRMKSLVLLGAGTGVVPLITIARSVDLRVVKLIFVIWDKTAEDALCQRELDDLRCEGDARVVRYFTRAQTKEDVHVACDLLKKLGITSAADILVAVCGPAAFNLAANEALLQVGFSAQVISCLQ